MLNEVDLQRTFAHAMALWFEPEIHRRQEAGTAPIPYHLRAAQVILHADIRPNEVRLNEEVLARGRVKLRTGVSKRVGDPIYLHDLEEELSIHLPDSVDPNCGHFTLVLIGNRWYCSFDFRYNKGKASELLDASKEFYLTASEALSAGRRRAAIDNLFSAAELAARAYVISTPLPGDQDGKKHSYVHTRFNMFAKHGNVDKKQLKTFNALSNCRTRARYVDGVLSETTEVISEWKANVEELIEQVKTKGSY